MNKRKLPDFLLEQDKWNKKECDKWLRGYAYLKIHSKKYNEFIEKLLQEFSGFSNLYQYLLKIINNCPDSEKTHIRLYQSFQKTAIVWHYLNRTISNLKEKGFDIWIDHIAENIKHGTYKHLGVKDKIPNLERLIQNEIFILQGIHIRFIKAFSFLKEFENDLYQFFSQMRSRTKYPRLQYKFTHAYQVTNFEEAKNMYLMPFYNENPELLLNDLVNHDMKFSKFLARKIQYSEGYKYQLDKVMNLFVVLSPKTKKWNSETRILETIADRNIMYLKRPLTIIDKRYGRLRSSS